MKISNNLGVKISCVTILTCNCYDYRKHRYPPRLKQTTPPQGQYSQQIILSKDILFSNNSNQKGKDPSNQLTILYQKYQDNQIPPQYMRQQDHFIFSELSDIGIEIEQAREELFEACEKSHLLYDDCNPTFQKDNAMAAESYNYAKIYMHAPYYKEILRVMGNFQKRINNARIKIESLEKALRAQPACCAVCDKSCNIKLILLGNYFKKDPRIQNKSLVSFSSLGANNTTSNTNTNSLNFSHSSSGCSETLDFSSTSYASI